MQNAVIGVALTTYIVVAIYIAMKLMSVITCSTGLAFLVGP